MTVEPILSDASRRLDGPEISVDLSAVTEADSSAVGLLLAWVRAAAGERFAQLELSALVQGITLTDCGSVSSPDPGERR
jgi:ABC-type transporter Mla MlaB component